MPVEFRGVGCASGDGCGAVVAYDRLGRCDRHGAALRHRDTPNGHQHQHSHRENSGGPKSQQGLFASQLGALAVRGLHKRVARAGDSNAHRIEQIPGLSEDDFAGQQQPSCAEVSAGAFFCSRQTIGQIQLFCIRNAVCRRGVIDVCERPTQLVDQHARACGPEVVFLALGDVRMQRGLDLGDRRNGAFRCVCARARRGIDTGELLFVLKDAIAGGASGGDGDERDYEPKPAVRHARQDSRSAEHLVRSSRSASAQRPAGYSVRSCATIVDASCRSGWRR